MPPRIPNHKRAQILADIRAGRKSRARIARDHNVVPSTVANIARHAGLTSPFARTQTKAATEAHIADNTARRATLATRLLHLGEQAITQAEMGLAETSALQAATIAGIAMDKHLAVARHDADPGVEAGKSMLVALAAGVGVAYQQLTETTERQHEDHQPGL
jgi:transposase-like protein